MSKLHDAVKPITFTIIVEDPENYLTRGSSQLAFEGTNHFSGKNQCVYVGQMVQNALVTQSRYCDVPVTD